MARVVVMAIAVATWLTPAAGMAAGPLDGLSGQPGPAVAAPPATASRLLPSSSASAPSTVRAAVPGGVTGSTTVPAPGQIASQELATENTSVIQQFAESISDELGVGSGFRFANLRSYLLGGRLVPNPEKLLAALLSVFTRQVQENLSILGELLVLVVLSAVLHQIEGAFDNAVVSRISDLVVFLAMGAICFVGFSLTIQVARTTVTNLSTLMLALLPAVTGLVTLGGAATAALLQPTTVAAVGVAALVVRSVVFPLVLFSAVLDIVGALSPSFRTSSLSGLLRQVGVGVLGLVLIVFFGVVSVGGTAAAITSGVTLRAAKYATKTFVPVVGGMFADAAELMLASGFLLKSGIGIFGLLVVLLTVALPVLKMMALWAIYRLAAALAQPVGGETISHVLGGVAGAVAILSLSVAAVGLACFLAVAVTVAAAGAVFAMH